MVISASRLHRWTRGSCPCSVRLFLEVGVCGGLAGGRISHSRSSCFPAGAGTMRSGASPAASPSLPAQTLPFHHKPAFEPPRPRRRWLPPGPWHSSRFATASRVRCPHLPVPRAGSGANSYGANSSSRASNSYGENNNSRANNSSGVVIFHYKEFFIFTGPDNQDPDQPHC